MFGWFKPKPSPPSGRTVVDLRLDHTTKKQDETLADFMSWANDLMTQRRFAMQVAPDDGINYSITLTRNEDVPDWLRCTIRADLYVEEDQRDRRVMGRRCTLLLDCRYTQEEDGPEAAFEVPFTSNGIAKARTALAGLLAKVR